MTSHILETIHLQARHKRVATMANDLWMLWKTDGLDAVEDAIRQGLESVQRDILDGKTPVEMESKE